MALVLLMAIVGSVGFFSTSVASDAAITPPHTTSYYERNANPAVLYRQGEQAGKADAQGIVILDFGRPAYLDGSDGTWSYSNAFISLVSIASAVESYVSAYYAYAPRDATLNVAVGTNNSCGTDQPCGGIICGCPDEPPSFTAWLRHAPNHANNWGVVQFVYLSDDDELRTWIAGAQTAR